MPLNMKPPFAHSNVAAVEGAWPVMGFTSHQPMHGEPPGRIVECSHFPRQQHGGSSEVGQREHMVRQGFTGRCWSEFLCLGGYLAPSRQVGVEGFAPRDSLGRRPSADPRRWCPAGGPVAGANLSTFIR
jgi:hypothetical protein